MVQDSNRRTERSHAAPDKDMRETEHIFHGYRRIGRSRAKLGGSGGGKGDDVRTDAGTRRRGQSDTRRPDNQRITAVCKPAPTLGHAAEDMNP